MAAAIDRGLFGFLTHEATANSTFSISVGSLSSARESIETHLALAKHAETWSGKR